MNILFLTPYLPYPLNNGGLIRVFHLLTNIAKKHQVTLLCMEPDNDKQREGIDILRSKGIDVNLIPVAANQKKEKKRLYQLKSLFSNKTYQYHQYYSKRMQQAITEQLDSNKYDLLMVEFSQMGYYDITTDIPRYVDQHNVEYEIMQRTYETEKSPLRRLLAKSEWRKYREHEIENCEKFSGCLTTSKRDADILQQRSPGMECHVIPNGVDSDFFKPVNAPVDPNMILFTGTISYYPNTEGILWFYHNIWHLVKQKNPKATFCIAGKSPPAEVQNLSALDNQITVTGAVDDMRDYYAKATVVVVPLRVGGGTRLKILEGMAMQKAIISTSVGAEGIDHTDGKNILLRDTPEAFADAVIEVMSNQKLRVDLEQAGRQLVEDKYDWQAVGSILCDVFEAGVKAA